MSSVSVQELLQVEQEARLVIEKARNGFIFRSIVRAP